MGEVHVADTVARSVSVSWVTETASRDLLLGQAVIERRRRLGGDPRQSGQLEIRVGLWLRVGLVDDLQAGGLLVELCIAEEDLGGRGVSLLLRL